MKILRNHILKDFFSVALFSLLIFSMIMFMGNLLKISDMVIRKGVNAIDTLKIFSFLIPYLLQFTIPLAFLLGVLLVMGRLIADNEITAIRVAGVSLVTILNIFLLLGIIFSLLMFILNDRVIPDFHYRYRSQVKNIYSKNISAFIEPGVFLDHFENYILYVSDKNGNKLKNVYIYEVDEKQGNTKTIFAKEGEFVIENDILTIKLEDGFRDETIAKDKTEIYRLNFKVFFMDIPIQKKEKVTVNKKPSDMRLKELKKKIENFRQLGIDPVEFKGEFHNRISFSFSIVTLVVLGFGISLVVRHREKSINFVIAFIAAGVYYLLFVLGETLVEYRMVSPMLGMWLPNLIIAPLGVFLIIKNAYFR